MTIESGVRYLKQFARILQFGGTSALWPSSFFKNAEIPITVAGERIVIRRGTPDLGVAMESLLHEYRFVGDYIASDYDGLIVDGGGYIGTAAIALARLFPRSTVLTIEPSSENFSILQKNVRLLPNIIARQAALFSEGGIEIELNDMGTGQWGFSIVEKRIGADRSDRLEQVTTISLKNITDEFSREIGFLKLDIEGGERDLFLNSTDELNKIPFILAELHDRVVSGCESAFRSLSSDRTVLKVPGEKFMSLLNKRGD